MDDFPPQTEMHDFVGYLNSVVDNLRVFAAEVRRVARSSAEPSGNREFRGIELPNTQGEWVEMMYVLSCHSALPDSALTPNMGFFM